MIDDVLTMIPGPSPVDRRVLEALGQPTVSHLAPTLVAAMESALASFRTLCRSRSAQPFIVAGGGTLAMEMALVNTAPQGGRVLVVSQGYFGDRYAELARAFGLDADVLQSEWGTAVPVDALRERLGHGRFDAVTVTHVDTSTGTCAPVAEYAEVLRGRDEIFVLDGVCATGGVDERFDEWDVDVLLTAPQKAIGAPPGAALCLFSERAIQRRRGFANVPAYYADVLRWLPVMQDPSRYFSTPCVNEVFALATALEIALTEGLDTRFERHRALAAALRAGFAACGIVPFTDPSRWADTLSVCLYPEGVDDIAFRTALARRGVVVAGALGAIAGRAFRVGHMGNIGSGEIAKTLDAVEASLRELGIAGTPGAALAAAGPRLAELA